MKLLNFSNLKFKWEYEKEIRFSNFYIQYECRFKYWFLHPASFYFEIDPYIKWIKKYYKNNFINLFKLLKMDIEDETTQFR